MMRIVFLVATLAAAVAVADANPFADYGPAMKSTAENPSAVDWSKANDARLAALTAPGRLASFVANGRSAKALLAQLDGAYRADPLSACQIAAVTQWVMLPDPWYCLFWDGDHAAGRKVWIKALLTRAETTDDGYVKTFCLDQLRWCGCDCPELIERLRALGAASGDKAVAEFAEAVVRGLEKKPDGSQEVSE